MRVKRKYLLLSSLLICIVVISMGFAHHRRFQDQEQVEFISGFYQRYLSQPTMKRVYYVVPPGSFYSKSAEALLNTNASLCLTLVRNDNICGYGADGDVFLDAQEIDPTLTYAKSGFRATSAGKNMVDVSFNVYPEYGSDYARKMRYLLVREANGWRVDDVLFGEDGGFPIGGMRSEINAENQHVLHEATEVSETASWVFSYLREPDMLDRAERFMAFPVEVCSKAGRCQTVQKGDRRLRQVMLTLHGAYYKDDSDTTTLERYWPTRGQVRAEPGKHIDVDALKFTFQGRAWWITNVDLSHLGQTIPVHRTN